MHAKPMLCPPPRACSRNLSMFSREQIYTVHENEDAGDAADRILLVREGFNVAAFVFTALWALMHRLWLFAATYLCLVFILYEVGTRAGFHEASLVLLHVGLQCWFGAQANDARRVSLARKGYEEIGVICAESLEQAELRHYRQQAA